LTINGIPLILFFFGSSKPCAAVYVEEHNKKGKLFCDADDFYYF